MTARWSRMIASFSRAVSWHRRKLAVLAAVSAVLTGISAAMPEEPPGVPVLRTTRPLAGGTTLQPADVAVVRVPASLVPDEALRTPNAVLGKVLVAPQTEGQILTALDVLTSRVVGPGQVVAPLRLPDAEVASVIRVGDRVDVVAADPETRSARVIATSVRVVTIPQPLADRGIGPPNDAGGALLLVEVDPADATRLAGAAAAAQLSVVFR